MPPFSSGLHLPTKKTLLSSPIKQILTNLHTLTSDTIVSSLQTCKDLKTLTKIHSCILTQGLGPHIFLGSKLLNLYAHFGAVSYSKHVFDKILNRNLSLWNSAIVGYFRAGCFEEVLSLYVRLKCEGIGVDSSSVTFSLKSCSELGELEVGRGVHGDGVKCGLNVDKFVGSSLIGLYSKCGDIEDARIAFDEIFEKDVVVYTAMITGYAQLFDVEARKVFGVVRSMRGEGLDANRVTLVSLLKASGQLGAFREGRCVHCYALRRGIGVADEVLETSLVDMYSRCGDVTSAASVLRGMEIRSVASWNAMVAGLVRCGRSSEALKCFNVMVNEMNLYPDSITVTNVLTACSDLNCTYLVTSIHCCLLRRGIPLDLVVTTAFIDLYSRCNKLKAARELFDEMTVRDVVTYNVMMSGYLQNGEVDEAVRMFRGMVQAGIEPNSMTMLSLLSAFSDLRDIRKGRWIHGFVIRNGHHANMDVCNQVLYMYAKWGFIDIAGKIFNSLAKKDLVSWTAMMMGYVNCGLGIEALALFQEMRWIGEKPDSVTLITVLQALSQLGCLEKVKEVHGHIYRTWLERDAATINSIIITYAKCGRLDIAETVFGSIVEPGLTSWNTMIAAYGIHGYCKEVLELFYRMPRENLKPNEMTFTSVLSACSHGGLVEEGWKIFNSMGSEYFSVTPKEEHYNCMVDLLARAGGIEEAYEFVKHSPLREKANALCALLAACRVHKNLKLGETIGEQLLKLEPQNTSTYALVSNLYSDSGKWDEAARLRIIAKEQGLRKIPGYSLIESHENSCGI